MFAKVLVANRGAIATRISRTLRRMGIAAVAVHSDADADSPHVTGAAEAVRLGPAPPAESYLDADRILDAARRTGAEAIHPGYGFLSEDPAFAERCEAAGLVFIGPTPRQMRDFGRKHTARELAAASGLPLLPGTGLLAGPAEALAAAERLGYPVMLKSSAGGGGIGMRPFASAAELADGFTSVERLARASFGDGRLYLEKRVARARHVEVQIFGDGAGHVLALGERDCSLQRRNQKVVEETPAPGLSAETRGALAGAALQLGRAAAYRSAGTVEFLLDADTGAFYFLEVNTRIQVEHGVTEAVTGVDLIEWMVRLAAGELPDLDRLAPTATGAAVEVRLCAEDPGRAFQPSCGRLTGARFPAELRVDTWIDGATEVTPHYDSLLAKLIASGPTRAEALARMERGLADCRIDGVETNLAYLRQVIASPGFRAGDVHTRFLEGVAYAPAAFEVLEGGTQTTVQDHPGRRGHWDVGVPPSGPMDARSFRLANRLVGNPASAAGLECTLVGPAVQFRAAAVIALTGADMNAELDGAPVPRHAPVRVAAGGVLRLGPVRGPGSRAYLAVRGGIDVPLVLGSRSTFTLGGFGGHAGRALRPGDVLHLAAQLTEGPTPEEPLAAALVPPLTRDWELAVLHGPHSAPDFFAPADIDALFAAPWEVHYHSSRTGVRLVGPKPSWARPDGGEAGLHPSNLHDNAYAIGTVNFTGDMPILLGPDGPSLGGFVCPATVIEADLWKLGQLKAGDTVRFCAVSHEEARNRAQTEAAVLAGRAATEPTRPAATEPTRPAATEPARPARAPSPSTAVLRRRDESAARPAMTIRQDGDANLLVEYGPMALDLGLRFRVHALMESLAARDLPGILDLTPGIRSLQIHHDAERLPRARLLDELERAEEELPATDAIEVPSRVVHLPLSWDDPAIRLAIDKYTHSVRPDAPWCPSNLEFIRRVNGLASVDDVRDIVFAASYLVLGLGDVYLGAPVATPIDPRHRLVTTKYNPARTWTPENAVGIGGAYLCVYGMEGPGGYQLVGRTCQMWNRRGPTADFAGGHPWLLRFFDQIRFYPVSEADLAAFRSEFPRGRTHLTIEPTTFRMSDYRAFLAAHRASIEAWKARQQSAFDAERRRWELLPAAIAPEAVPDEADEPPLGSDERAIRAQVTGSVWRVLVEPGQTIRCGENLLVLETMKMEAAISAPTDGIVARIAARPGALVRAGDLVAVLRSA